MRVYSWRTFERAGRDKVAASEWLNGVFEVADMDRSTGAGGILSIDNRWAPSVAVWDVARIRS